jgi:hypothetical protein
LWVTPQRPLILFRLFGLVAEEAVISEPISVRWFPCSTGKYRGTRPISGLVTTIVPAFILEIQSLTTDSIGARCIPSGHPPRRPLNRDIAPPLNDLQPELRLGHRWTQQPRGAASRAGEAQHEKEGLMLHPCRVHLRHQADTHGISTQHKAKVCNIKRPGPSVQKSY